MGKGWNTLPVRCRVAHLLQIVLSHGFISPRTCDMENQPTPVIENVPLDPYSQFLMICYAVLGLLSLMALLAAVPILLAKRASRPQQMPWWLVVVLSAASGWLASNGFAYFSARELELQMRQSLGTYWVPAPLSLTLPFGWIVGIVYLLVCLAAYPMFLLNEGRSASRLIKGALIVASGVFVAAWVPPWADTDLLLAGWLGYFFTLVLFVLCAGACYRVLRAFQLQGVGWAFLVMFLVSLLIRSSLGMAFDALAGVVMIWPFVSRGIWNVEWAVLFAALFTAFWWIAIRARPVSHARSLP